MEKLETELVKAYKKELKRGSEGKKR